MSTSTPIWLENITNDFRYRRRFFRWPELRYMIATAGNNLAPNECGDIFKHEFLTHFF